LIEIKSIIATIEALLAQGTPQAITYAALECRLAIEKICYDRLTIAHEYISHDDLRRWQPQQVVQTLVAEVDGNIASTYTVSMSREPANQSGQQLTAEELKDLEWVKIGTQVGFDPKLLGRLWNSLSNLALHVRLPKTKDEFIPAYGDAGEIRRKVEETVAELKRVASGTLLSSGFGEEVFFNCDCGRLIKRRSKLLRNGQTINCVGVDCDQSYTVAIDGADIKFEPRFHDVDCVCGRQHRVPRRMLDKLEVDRAVNLECECGEHYQIAWKLAVFMKKREN
jgi:hypothetical protein